MCVCVCYRTSRIAWYNEYYEPVLSHQCFQHFTRALTHTHTHTHVHTHTHTHTHSHSLSLSLSLSPPPPPPPSHTHTCYVHCLSSRVNSKTSYALLHSHTDLSGRWVNAPVLLVKTIVEVYSAFHSHVIISNRRRCSGKYNDSTPLRACISFR